MPTHRHPLAGLRVLDLSRVLAGPVCCQLLADLGADVVKVERPGMGDDTRHWGPPFVDDSGPSAYYLSANRGKRSLALDLAHPEGQKVLVDLLRRADAMVENFLPDTVERLGLTPERLQELNPRLVSCSISGYGRTGPMADTPGYDLVVQATSGIMSITGEPDGSPMKVGVAITDVLTGLYAATSLLAGLYARHEGRDRWAFDLALTDCTLASLVNVVQAALVTGTRPPRWGNAHPQIVPYQLFATRDGHMVLAVGNDRQWQRFCEAASRPDLAEDPRFATNPLRVSNRDELIQLLEPIFASRTTRDWQTVLGQRVPHAPVLAVDQALQEPQVAAREMIDEVVDRAGRRYRILNGAVHWHDEPSRVAVAPPALGEHTDTILREWLGYNEERIRTLHQAGVVA